MGAPNRLYSINSSAVADTYVLRKVYYYWEFYYIDERGNQNDYRKFVEENDTCVYMLETIKQEMKT